MKKIILLCLLTLCVFPVVAQIYTVESSMGAHKYEGEVGNGMEAVYMLNTLSGATIKCQSKAASVNFYRYQNSLADKVEIPKSDISPTPALNGGTTYTISNLEDNRGYLMEENNVLKNAVWIMDYTLHLPQLNSIMPEDGNQCETLVLLVDKSDDLTFHLPGGAERRLDRRYTIRYETLKWDDTNKLFGRETATLKNKIIGKDIFVDAPLTNTLFDMSDHIAAELGINHSVKSNQYQAVAVEGYIGYEILNNSENGNNNGGQEEEDNQSLNERSTPLNVKFTGYGNTPVVGHYTWFIYRGKPEKGNEVARLTGNEAEYEFNEPGDYIVMLETAESSSICVDTTYTESFHLYYSELKEPPNFFTPRNADGINDEFKVTYRSLESFQCTIFNRWGNKLYQWNDPAKGWDGKYKGKVVAPGVYFYVIRARGSDGRKFNESGDINIL